MIDLPLSNGVVAALIFVVFELFVFPILLDSTTKAAYILMSAKAKKRESLRVQGMSFPLWNNGLIHGNCSHYVLLILRITCIAIPVYLETRLDSYEQIGTITLPRADVFIIGPRNDWGAYEVETGDSIASLLSAAESVFDTCTEYSRDGWLIAKEAVVRYTPNNRIERVYCFEDLSTQVFRNVPGSPPTVKEAEGEEHRATHEREFTLDVSWYMGFVRDFPPSPEKELGSLENAAGDDVLYTFENVSLQNANGMECFAPSRFAYVHGPNMEDSWLEHNFIMCQNMTQKTTEFYITGIMLEANLSEKPTPRAPDKMQTTEVVNLEYMGRLEFKGDPIVTAKHLIAFEARILSLYHDNELQDLIRQSLYTRIENSSVTIPTESSVSRTVMDTVLSAFWLQS